MKKSELNLLINILLIFAIFLSITGFFTDVSNTVKFGGVDLRNRVVGARLLKKDIDPYYYKWKEGDPVELLDPRDKVNSKVNMVTVPPSMLLLMSPFVDIKYNIQRVIWLIMQWFLLLLSIFFFSQTFSTSITKKMVWIIGLFFIGSSFFWRLHIERGQIYILYVMLISMSYFFNDLKIKPNELWSGIIIGFAIVLRPPLLLLPMLFLFYKKWKVILGTIIGAILTLSICLLVSGWQVWLSYFSAMRIHGLNHLHGLQQIVSHYPYQNIEGISNLYGLANIPIADTSLQGLFKSIGVLVPGNILMLGFILFLILIVSYLLKQKIRLSTELIFLFASFLIFISDFFLPAARYSYNNVMLLPFILIIILKSKELLQYFSKH